MAWTTEQLAEVVRELGKYPGTLALIGSLRPYLNGLSCNAGDMTLRVGRAYLAGQMQGWRCDAVASEGLRPAYWLSTGDTPAQAIGFAAQRAVVKGALARAAARLDGDNPALEA